MILFADLATRTGVAWGAGETQPQLRTLDFNIMAFEHGMKRNTSSALEIGAFVTIAAKVLNELVDEVRPTVMLFESPLLHGMTNISTLRKLYGLAGIYEGIAFARGIPCYEEQNGKLKEELCGYGGAEKDFMIASAKIFGMDPEDDNSADAFAGWLMGVRQLRHEVYQQTWAHFKNRPAWIENAHLAKTSKLKTLRDRREAKSKKPA